MKYIKIKSFLTIKVFFPNFCIKCACRESISLKNYTFTIFLFARPPQKFEQAHIKYIQWSMGPPKHCHAQQRILLELNICTDSRFRLITDTR